MQARPWVWSLPRGGHRLSWEAGGLVLPCLPLLPLFMGHMAWEDSFPLWASISPSGDGDTGRDRLQGPVSLGIRCPHNVCLGDHRADGLFLTSLGMDSLALSRERNFWKWVLLPPHSSSMTVRLLPLPSLTLFSPESSVTSTGPNAANSSGLL